jgi:hypothetical protein
MLREHQRKEKLKLLKDHCRREKLKVVTERPDRKIAPLSFQLLIFVETASNL